MTNNIGYLTPAVRRAAALLRVAVSLLFLSTMQDALTATVDPARIQRLALAWMQGNPGFQATATTTVSPRRFHLAAVTALPLDPVSSAPIYHVALAPSGYLLMSGDDRLPAVLAFSTDSDLDFRDRPDNHCRALIQASGRQMRQTVQTLDTIARGGTLTRGGTDSVSALTDFAAANQKQWDALAAAPAGTTTITVNRSVTRDTTILVPVMLSTTWNQTRHYNFFCPPDPDPDALNGYDGRVATGCTATATGQAMKYYAWPPYGTGQHTYTDTGTINGQHSADFSDPYDWNHMQDSYNYATAEPADNVAAVAELMYELGVAVNMDYESDGSSASYQAVAEMLAAYFFYDSPALIERIKDPAAFDAMLRGEILAGRPAEVSVPGHAVLADGLENDGVADYYHINYGWGGTNNGWYLVTDIVGDCLDYGIFGIQPKFMPLFVPSTVPDNTSGHYTLNWAFPGRRLPQVEKYRLYEGHYAGTSFSDSCDTFSQWQNKGWTVAAGGNPGACFRMTSGQTGSYALTLLAPLLPTAASQLSFTCKALLDDDHFTVEVSTDNGLNWTTKHDISKINPPSWTPVMLSLAEYAGQAVTIRFGFSFPEGSYYVDGGVWLDSIAVSNCSPVTWQVLTDSIPAETISYNITGAAMGVHYYRLEAFHTQTREWGDGSPNLKVTVTNLAPVISGPDPVAVTMSEDGTPVAFDLSLTASDPGDEADLSWRITTPAAHGTAATVGSGTTTLLNYSPYADYNGSDSFSVEVADRRGATATVQVNVSITPVSDPLVITEGNPVAVAMDEDGTPAAFSLTLHAADPDHADTLTWSVTIPAGHGSATATGTGTSQAVHYMPTPDWNGTDAFSVQVADGAGRSSTSSVHVTIAPRNDPPQNTAVPMVTGTPRVGQTLAAQAGAWSDTLDLVPGNVTLTRQWQRAADAAGTNAADIPGATAATYTLTMADAGKWVGVKETATDNGEGLPSVQNRSVTSAWMMVEDTAFTLTVTDPMQPEITLDFGLNHNATDAYDAGLDELSGTGNPDLAQACFTIETATLQRLRTDFRPFAAMTRWRLSVEMPTGAAPLELSWNVAAADPANALYLQKLQDELAIGYPINMKTTSACTVTETSLFEIAYAPPVTITCMLTPGWNLMGIPVMSPLPVSGCFPDTRTPSVRVGPVWFWQNGAYQCLPEDGPLYPERGYWVYSPAGGQLQPITGLPADGRIRLKTGWNLISPVASCVISQESSLRGLVWGWSRTHYFPATTLEIGQSYWIYAPQDTLLLLPTAE